MDLGKIIKDCRELRDMSHAEMAFRTGMTVDEIKQIELGLTPILPETPQMQIIMEALDIPESMLLFFAVKDLGVAGLGNDLEERIESMIVNLIEASNDEEAE